MFTVTVPAHMFWLANTYLEHNGQYPNREYYRSSVADGGYKYTFDSPQRYQAFSEFIARRSRYV